jgi:hypothetical protein
MIIMMIFNMSNFIFSQNFISLFWGLFNGGTDLRVRVSKLVQMDVQTKFDWCTWREVGKGPDILHQITRQNAAM